MHQAYRHQGRWKVQKSVGGMGGPKNIEDLLKEKGVCFWDSQNMGGGQRPPGLPGPPGPPGPPGTDGPDI